MEVSAKTEQEDEQRENFEVSQKTMKTTINENGLKSHSI